MEHCIVAKLRNSLVPISYPNKITSLLYQASRQSKSLVPFHPYPRGMPVTSRPLDPLKIHQRRLLVRSQPISHRVPLFHTHHPLGGYHGHLRGVQPARGEEAEGVTHDDGRGPFGRTDGDVPRCGCRIRGVGGPDKM